jgi:hypothetical protein
MYLASSVDLETVHVMSLAHPVFAAAAIPAVTARDDLVGDDTLADGESLNFGAELDNLTDKFVSGYNRLSDPFRLAVPSPIPRSAVPGFDIAGADPAGLDFDNHLVSGSGRYRDRLKFELVGTILDDSGHRRFGHKTGRA